MNQINLQNRLAVSNGIVKNGQNKAMQLASQTTESPETAKKYLGLLAVLAVGVDAAASFLKSKMEKAADAVLGTVQIQPPKIAVNRLAKGKARLVVSAHILALLAGIFAASPDGMATPRGIWLPKYKRVQEHRHIIFQRTYIPFLKVWRFVPLPHTLAWDTEIEFSSEYLIPNSPGSLVNARAVAVEETHKAGRYNSAWQKKTTYLTWQGNKVTRHRFIENKKEVQRWYTNGGHLDLVFHTKIGEMQTISNVLPPTYSGGRIQEKLTETWENKVYFYETQRMSGGPFHFSVHFGARNDFIPSDDLNCSGYCEAGRISAYPGSATWISPCVPSNMSMPSNGYLEFHHWTQYVPDPDDDDE